MAIVKCLSNIIAKLLIHFIHPNIESGIICSLLRMTTTPISKLLDRVHLINLPKQFSLAVAFSCSSGANTALLITKENNFLFCQISDILA